MSQRLFTLPGETISGLSIDIANLLYSPIGHNHTLISLSDVSGVFVSGNEVRHDGTFFVPYAGDAATFEVSGTSAALAATLSGLYQASGLYEVSGTSEALDATLAGRFQASGLYQVSGTAYTKVESDQRFATSGHNHDGIYQPVGFYMVSGDSFTKAETDIRYEVSGSVAALNAGLPARFQASGSYQPAGPYITSSGIWEISGTSQALAATLPASYQASGSYQPAGNYALSGAYITSSGNWEISGSSAALAATLPGLYQASGNYALSGAYLTSSGNWEISGTSSALNAGLPARFQASGLYQPSGNYITQAAGDIRYQLSGTSVASSGNWEISGTSADLNAGLPARFQASGLYEISGTSFTKAESDVRYAFSGMGGGGGGPHTIDSHSNFTGIPSSGQVLEFDGTNWTPAWVSGTAGVPTDPATFEGSGLYIDGNGKLSVGAGWGIEVDATNTYVDQAALQIYFALSGSYQPSGDYITSSGSWEISGTSAALDAGLPARFQASGNYQAAGNYQPSGNYQVSGNYITSSGNWEISGSASGLAATLPSLYAASGHTHPDIDTVYETSGTSEALANSLPAIYQASGLYEVSGTSHTKQEANARFEVSGTSSSLDAGLPARFQASGNYQPAGNYQVSGDYVTSSGNWEISGTVNAFAATLPALYQASGNYQLSGTSFTKAESTARFQVSGFHDTLANLTDVSVPAPITGDVLRWTGTAWTAQANSQTVGSAVDLYLDATIAVADNLKLSTSPSVFAETIKTVSVSSANSPVFLERFTSDALGRDTLASGIWNFHTYGASSSTVGNTKIHTRINLRELVHNPSGLNISGVFTGAGITRSFHVASGEYTFTAGMANASILLADLVETPTQTGWVSAYLSPSGVTVTLTDLGFANGTYQFSAKYRLLFSGESADINSSTPADLNFDVIANGFPIQPDDRLVAAYFATCDSAAARNVSLYYGGSVNYSHISTPISTLHNNLAGLNVGDYLHLTAAEYAIFNAMPVSGTSYTKAESDVRYALSGTGGGGSSTLDGLTDVVAPSPTSGQILAYDGLNWVNYNQTGGGTSYTKAESDSRFLASGLYETSGTGYTKAESDLRYAQIPSGLGIPVFAYLSTDSTTTIATNPVPISGLALHLVASATYELYAHLTTSGNDTGGIVYGIQYTGTGTIEASIVGNTNAVSTFTRFRVSGFNYSAAQNTTPSMNTTTTVEGQVFAGTVTTTTSGNLSLAFARATNGTARVLTGSHMRVIRIN